MKKSNVISNAAFSPVGRRGSGSVLYYPFGDHLGEFLLLDIVQIFLEVKHEIETPFDSFGFIPDNSSEQ